MEKVLLNELLLTRILPHSSETWNMTLLCYHSKWSGPDKARNGWPAPQLLQPRRKAFKVSAWTWALCDHQLETFYLDCLRSIPGLSRYEAHFLLGMRRSDIYKKLNVLPIQSLIIIQQATMAPPTCQYGQRTLHASFSTVGLAVPTHQVGLRTTHDACMHSLLHSYVTTCCSDSGI